MHRSMSILTTSNILLGADMICRKFLDAVAAPQKALEILVYAIKHGDLHSSWATSAAKYAISVSPNDAFQALPGKQFLQWVILHLCAL
jgi:hypothetical protein